jgi:hypothetical protein
LLKVTLDHIVETVTLDSIVSTVTLDTVVAFDAIVCICRSLCCPADIIVHDVT